jgi:hypothetical protein
MGDSSGDIDREEFLRDFLNRGDANERRVRGVFRALPHAPRCQNATHALALKGKEAPIEVVSLRVVPDTASSKES